MTETGEKQRVKIQRVRCRACNASHSLLYDWLIPHRKYTLGALKAVVVKYIQEENSYLDTLTGAVNETATAFYALEWLLSQLPTMWMFLMRMAISRGLGVKEIRKEGSCPNSFKCRKAGKKAKLDWVARLLELVPEMFEIGRGCGYAVMGSNRGCALLRTHLSECALF